LYDNKLFVILFFLKVQPFKHFFMDKDISKNDISLSLAELSAIPLQFFSFPYYTIQGKRIKCFYRLFTFRKMPPKKVNIDNHV